MAPAGGSVSVTANQRLSYLLTPEPKARLEGSKKARGRARLKA